ncbi:ABC transporter ATP-binding protein [Methanomicrobiaceae archaeon CYW5]|uniref:energy-coupling factor ABC transporter ATP-binding protein n=1 Tax=Methanovulcanius yangii TaxID=1789227 RepID=UPI0029CA073C|nr:ABC transporter ATP-binding protein [Methanovulcanius yangii]MBT8507630.1 ABC transporter ATP-binding protein [Methanovulcanius yangii]
MTCILELTDITYRYPNGPAALDKVSLRLMQGEKIALVGPNGAGKSTLLRMLNGMLRPDSGTVRFQGEPVSYTRKDLKTLRRKVGFVFQNPDHQIIAPTVFQDVAFGPANLDYTPEEMKRAVDTALSYVGLSAFGRRPPHQLSGGEKKKVAMAGVLAMDPDMLVFDEPTSALDPESARSIMDLLDELHQAGKSIIISTHDVELAYTWADRIIIMHDGRILIASRPEEAFSDKGLLAEAQLSQPLLIELYEALCELEMVPSTNMPHSVLDVVAMLDTDHRRPRGSTPRGFIVLADAGGPDTERVKQTINDETVAIVGGMGTVAKNMAARWGISLTYTHGVIDKCLLKAISGHNSLILTNGGMMTRVVDRVEEFNAESGDCVEVVHFDDYLHIRQ